MELRLANEPELEAIVTLIDQAKAHLKGLGVNQWQAGYPDVEAIRQDLQRQVGYVLTEAGAILGYLCLDLEGEPAYQAIKGQWKSIQPYAVIHRMTIDDAQKGKKLAQKAFGLVETFCQEKGIHSIKVDTHPENKAMNHILQKLGFAYCGLIWFADGDKVAYEKLV